ncbi:unnamed protein product [Lactuca virosa]|uniref:Late embryogenesis abundant protein LEA-2 subgroup domain-containing protein n=1 Tax=Lactuca virosa TaxID=75947 RepID=A0AAU9LCT0_9ASTR|nr:unnamed protein product [Lactuca virosa]
MADPPPSAAGNRNSATVHPVSAPSNAPQNQATHCSYQFKQRVTYFLFGSIVLICILILFRRQISLVFISNPQFRLQTLTISNFHYPPELGNLISGDLDADFILRNSNSKTTLHYHKIQAAVWDDWLLISNTSVRSFVQGPKKKTAVRATFSSFIEYIDDEDSFDGESKSGHVVINFDFRMMVTYRLNAWWARRWRDLKVYCHGLQVDVSLKSRGGKMIGGWKNCKADGYFFSVDSPHFALFNNHH